MSCVSVDKSVSELCLWVIMCELCVCGGKCVCELCLWVNVCG